MWPLRTLLFVPAVRPDRIPKALASGADGVIIDLEDSVPAPEKDRARKAAAEALGGLKGGPWVFVRINGTASPWWEEDIQAVTGPTLSGLLLPKVEGQDAVHRVDRRLWEVEISRGLDPGSIRLIPVLESALGVLRAFEVASASPRNLALAFGAEDLARDLRVERTQGGGEVALPRAMVALAARAAGLEPLDMVYTDLEDEAGLVREAKEAKGLGYAGKILIHPRQVPAVNQVFSPTPEEVEESRSLILAFEASGGGAIRLKGKMVDLPAVERAREILRLSEAIAQRERR